MELKHSKKGNAKEDILKSNKRLNTVLAAAVVAATLSPFSPLAERAAHAEEPSQPKVITLEGVSVEGKKDAPPAPVVKAPPKTEAVVPDIPVAAAPTVAVDSKDHLINGHEDLVDMNGRVRHITLDNSWDIGGNVYSNEAGSAIYASIRFKRLLRLDGGNFWFGEQPAPFATLSVKPELTLGNVKGLYYGRVSTLGNMPSYIYSSHALGLGISQPFGAAKDWRLRIGIVGGAAVSFPAYDDIYSSISAGVSVSYKNWLLYSAPTFYWAANTPMQTAYVGYYKPRFQSIESGLQATIGDYTGRIYADIGMLKNTYAFRASRSIDFKNNVSGDIWAGTGLTRWNDALGGQYVWSAMFGMTFVIGGEHINSTNTMRYEHIQAGGVAQAQTDIPSKQNPGPYGYGRSGNADWDAQVNDAKNRMLGASSFDGFTRSYAGSSQDQVINTARFIGAFMQQVAYSNGAMNALNQTKFFDPEVIKVASTNNDNMLYYLQKYVNWYNTHSPGDQLPDDLRNGIAICAGIHSLMADFMRANGVPTLVASVNTRNGPHVIAIAMPKDKTVLLDYGNAYTTPANTFDQTLRFYGQQRGAPTFQSQLFNQDGYMGTYVTPEGRLLHQTIGVYTPMILFRNFLGVR
jgi:hypothetical protein